ncbi:PASTA domain-containing protein [Frigoriflavimonas asaccharolytica]|uniref:Serine/threonine-protein kinase n=1 Tax=Frigoriflavimonas asaccharolytica TaxID=2735899 RepID=A0A8J8G8B2_9FLAO|nr:PASTA domain-containing protein [Frigoriflavimonas asaccharolytica]NRS91349.1 serine/threonine-protein kinase [Frigoriflavimonas asaccharolytica]
MLKSLFHWKVLVNIIVAAVIFCGLVWLTFRWLEYHTKHGEETPVPNVVNLTMQKAIKQLDDAGLAYDIDSGNYNPAYRPFQVLDIFPKPGARVKNGRSIYLKVNPRSYAPVQVPDILDTYKGLAFRQLESVGLKVGDTIFEPSIQKDAVIRMMFNGNTLKPGTLLKRFSTIDLVIGSGPLRNIGVPNLVGMTVAQAKAMIANNLFETGLIEHEDGKEDANDIIYYQDPAGGSIRDQGMQIDLWASKKTPAELGGKISYLNSIYRMKIDTTLAPIRYEEIPSYNDPVFTPDSDVPPTPDKQIEKPAPVKPDATKKPVDNKPTTVKKPTETKPTTSKPADKPKPKGGMTME